MSSARNAWPTAPTRRNAVLRSATRLLVIALSATLAIPMLEASAVTTGGLQAQANAIAGQVAADNAALERIGHEYLAAANDYQRDLRTLASTTHELGVVRAKISQTQHLLERAAVQAYVGEGSTDALSLYLSGQPGRITTTNAYLGIASRDVASAVATLSNDRAVLASTRVTEQRTTIAAKAALASSTTARSRALATVISEQNVLSSVTGQLAALVAAQTAAAERAAAARADAAAAAASAAASVAASAAASAGPPAPSAVVTISTTSSAPTSIAASFAAIRNCESSGDYSLNTGNGYYGAYQFSYQTWIGLGGTGLASSASPSLQDAAAYKLYLSSGWSAWPECAAIAGLT